MSAIVLLLILFCATSHLLTYMCTDWYSWVFDFRDRVGPENVLLVYYELLKQDTPRELRRIAKFLHLENQVRTLVTVAWVQLAF